MFQVTTCIVGSCAAFTFHGTSRTACRMLLACGPDVEIGQCLVSLIDLRLGSMTEKTTESIAEVAPSEPLKRVLGIYFAAHRRVLPTRFELPLATFIGRVTVVFLKSNCSNNCSTSLVVIGGSLSPNEREISHGRVSWQTLWPYFEGGAVRFIHWLGPDTRSFNEKLELFYLHIWHCHQRV